MKNYQLILDDLLKANSYLSAHLTESDDILSAMKFVSFAITEIKELKENQDKELDSQKEEYLKGLKDTFLNHDCRWEVGKGCPVCEEYMKLNKMEGLAFYAAGRLK